MVRSSSPKSSFCIYYARANLTKLLTYERVVLQPGHYTSKELESLSQAGTQPLAYLSLGEDFSQKARRWHRDYNPDWHTHYVDVGHPDWHTHVLRQAQEALDKGFGGLFLDTLDVVERFPKMRTALLELIRKLRSETSQQALAQQALVVNRGFALFSELAPLINALIFEGFSTRWLADGGYVKLRAEELKWTAQQLNKLRSLGVKVYALDYADTPQLRNFARRRAREFGLDGQISNRELTELP